MSKDIWLSTSHLYKTVWVCLSNSETLLHLFMVLKSTLRDCKQMQSLYNQSNKAGIQDLCSLYDLLSLCLPSGKSKSVSSCVNEKIGGHPEGPRSAMLHQEGGAWHHFREERAKNQPVPGAGGAQLLSEVGVCVDTFCFVSLLGHALVLK